MGIEKDGGDESIADEGNDLEIVVELDCDVLSDGSEDEFVDVSENEEEFVDALEELPPPEYSKIVNRTKDPDVIEISDDSSRSQSQGQSSEENSNKEVFVVTIKDTEMEVEGQR